LLPRARLAAREWLAEREAELLPVPYYHVVFSLPAAIAYQNKAVIYDLLLKASSETLLTVAADPCRASMRKDAPLLIELVLRNERILRLPESVPPARSRHWLTSWKGLPGDRASEWHAGLAGERPHGYAQEL
jgi:hypothetical protein